MGQGFDASGYDCFSRGSFFGVVLNTLEQCVLLKQHECRDFDRPIRVRLAGLVQAIKTALQGRCA